MLPPDRWPLRTLIAVICLWMAQTAAGADGFRVENRVVRADGVELAQSTTILKEGTGYDFSQATGIVTVFDPANRRYVLLNRKRNLKVTIGFDEVEEFVEDLRRHAAEFPSELLRFQANPQLEEQYDPRTATLRLTSPWLVYTVSTTTGATESMVADYIAFCDGLARLNAHTNPGASPPFARLAVNAALAKRQRLPTKVDRKAFPSRNSQTSSFQVHSEHIYSVGLRDADAAQIAAIERELDEFSAVSLTEFYGPKAARTARRRPR